MAENGSLDWDFLKKTLYAAVVSDVLDSLGVTRRVPSAPLLQVSGSREYPLIGRCKTTLWADMAHEDPKPYALELRAVDSCRPGEILIAAAGGSTRSALWGELLSTASMRTGCQGAIVDGLVRDQKKMEAIGFTVFCRGSSPLDSRDRQRVIDLDVAVEIGSARVCPGDLVIADADGLVFIPREVEGEVLKKALEKAIAENTVRDAIRGGLSATDAFAKYGVL